MNAVALATPIFHKASTVSVSIKEYACNRISPICWKYIQHWTYCGKNQNYIGVNALAKCPVGVCGTLGGGLVKNCQLSHACFRLCSLLRPKWGMWGSVQTSESVDSGMWLWRRTTNRRAWCLMGFWSVAAITQTPTCRSHPSQVCRENLLERHFPSNLQAELSGHKHY